MHPFCFRQALPSDKDLILSWLEKPHVQEWLHGEGLSTVIQDLDTFFKGISQFTHWIAYQQEIPFAYLLTSLIDKTSGEDPLAQYCAKKGEAITLDVFIGNINYLGQGLAGPMIREFILSRFPYVTQVLIDPEQANQRAVHVYQKIGFSIVGDFTPAWHPAPHFRMILNVGNLKT